MATRGPGRRLRGASRRGPEGAGPWLLLLAITVAPAAGLWGLANWASARTDGNQAAPAIDPAVDAPMPTAALATGMLTYRRLPAVVSRSANAESLASVVDDFVSDLNDRSCAAVSVDGQFVGGRNGDVAVIPASNQKLPVAAVALDVLGADFRYTTRVAAATEPVDGVVDGALYLVGGGDPLLSSDWYPTSNLERYPVTTPTSLDTLADSVAAAGIVRVTGGVVGDGSRYDDEYAAPGWGLGVAGLEAGPYDALMANDSRVLGDDRKATDPSEGAAREFARLLEERGIDVIGDASSGVAPRGMVEVATITSAPMADVVAEMLRNSDNNTAEMLVKELGATRTLPGARSAGLAVVRQRLGAWGVDLGPVVLVDGSGLSVDNRLTCNAVLTVLQIAGLDSPIGSGLPVAAESGTLDDAFVGHAVAGRLTGKTGTLNNPPFNADPPAAKALAGFLPVDGGGAVEYVLLLNGPTISDQSEYRPLWGALADALDSYPAGPSPAELGPQ